jgi:tRNA (adenine57-N1/adenine58-N1)-methyltransferase catalytic subunit
MQPIKPNVQYGDLAQLVSPSNKTYTILLNAGGQLQTHRGVVNHDDLVGKPWGSQVYSHLGSAFYLMPPALGNLLQESRRNTQIMYPKDIGYILVMMGIGPGSHVVEAGTGSGAFTTALAWAVGPQGHVISYEARADMQNLARKNLEKLGLQDRVTLKLKDISLGLDESNVEILFLDLPNPYDLLEQVYAAMMPGGFFGCILPTSNQVSRMISALYRCNFAFIDVCEIMLRFYKANPNRFRPTDRMVAHTGYLVFARPFLPGDAPPPAYPGVHEADPAEESEAK